MPTACFNHSFVQKFQFTMFQESDSGRVINELIWLENKSNSIFLEIVTQIPGDGYPERLHSNECGLERSDLIFMFN